MKRGAGTATLPGREGADAGHAAQYQVGTRGNDGWRIRVYKTLANSGGVSLVSLRLSSVVAIFLNATGAAMSGVLAGGCVLLPDCDIEIRGTSASPSGTTVVSALERACGVLSNFNTKVVVHSGVVAADDGDVVFSTFGQYSVTFAWLDDQTVDVTFDCYKKDRCDPRIATPLGQRASANGISLRYHRTARLQRALAEPTSPAR